MAMSLAIGGAHRAEINMTPMIDILLVLIIIFMVITPPDSRGLNALVPQEATEASKAPPPAGEIVITVQSDHSLLLNREALTLDALQARLLDLFKRGAMNVVFVRGDKDLDFRYIAEVIDLARGAGLGRVALMTN